MPPAPYDFNYYQNSFLFNGLSAYFNEVSLGNLDFAGSRVGGERCRLPSARLAAAMTLVLSISRWEVRPLPMAYMFLTAYL